MYMNWLAQVPQSFWKEVNHKIGKFILQLHSKNANLCEETQCFYGTCFEKKINGLYLFY